MISLIISVYNKAPFLKRCLASVTEQYDKSAQIIVVDDGSDDGSEKICDYYEKIGFEIYHTKNHGVSAARNFGMEKAKGDYIAFLDADDILLPDATAIMASEAAKGLNIVQFRHIKCKDEAGIGLTLPYATQGGDYGLDTHVKHWMQVWNKIYSRKFLKDNHLNFREGMQYGEDTLFNVEAILANNGLHQSEAAIMIHILDDANSLCRRKVETELVKKLDDELCALADAQTKSIKRDWVNQAINNHRQSNQFKKRGFRHGLRGKYDVVYIVKESPENEELRYSLRTLEENWQYKRVWFAGGCPDGLKPDRYFKVSQTQDTKWERIWNLIKKVCGNDEITEDFWLFNDDFFILRSISENMPAWYQGELGAFIEGYERKRGHQNGYSVGLRKTYDSLIKAGLTTVDYEVHKPILINRKKALEVFKKFPEATPGFRSQYGNYCHIGGVDKHDMKIEYEHDSRLPAMEMAWEFVSISDESFAGAVGKFIKNKFTEPSRFEKEVKNEYI